MREFRDKTAIVGVGTTPCMKESGVSVLNLAVQAVKEAIDDAGLKPTDIDGIGSYNGADSVTPHHVASALGIPELRWNGDYAGGGFASNTVVLTAAAMVNMGICNYAVVYRAMNGRSGVRIGGGPTSTGVRRARPGGVSLGSVYGINSAPPGFDLKARAHMEKYGTISEQFGWVAVATRYHASLNPQAQMKRIIRSPGI
ncbi:MAG: hypothetical protein V1724_02550 [Chloroflexota bacterium]